MREQTRQGLFLSIHSNFINGNLSEYKKQVNSLGKKNLVRFIIYCFHNAGPKPKDILMILN